MDGWKMEPAFIRHAFIYQWILPRRGGEVYFQRGPPACGRLLDETRPVLRFFLCAFLSERDSWLSLTDSSTAAPSKDDGKALVQPPPGKGTS